MPWFKVDDNLVGNKKFARIPRAGRMAAIGLWTTLGSWCARELTNGHVEAFMIKEVGGTKPQADALVAADLWSVVDGGYQFVNWDEYQPTREDVEAKRDGARERMQKLRAGSQHVRANTNGSSRPVRDRFTTPLPVPLPVPEKEHG